jgi:hypothetical protein
MSVGCFKLATSFTGVTDLPISRQAVVRPNGRMRVPVGHLNTRSLVGFTAGLPRLDAFDTANELR